jgi:gas vesicle protein
MTNETLRMQMLSGVITESEYKAKLQENKKKKSLKESMIGGIVGIGAINQIPPRAKTDYEMAFEHFLGERYDYSKFDNPNQDPYTMKEEEEVEEGKEVQESSLYEDNPLEGGPGHMTKHRIGVISTLISDAEKDLIKYKESSFFTPELIEKMKGTIERLKSTLEDLKSQYEEEIKALSNDGMHKNKKIDDQTYRDQMAAIQGGYY